MKYARLAFRILIVLVFAAIGFLVGALLPIAAYWVIHGDPGELGGAALGIVGLYVGVVIAIIAGFFAFVKLHPRRELSK